LVAAFAVEPGHSLRTSAAVGTPNITIAGPGAPVAIGSNFDVQVRVDSGMTAVNTYLVEIDVPAGLSFISGTREPTGTFPSCFSWARNDLHPTWYNTGCSHLYPDTTFTGQVETVTLRCESEGTFSLNLVDPSEDPDVFGSTLIDQGGTVTTNLTPDGEESVTCYTPAAVGGIAELPLLARASAERAAAPGERSGWSGGSYAAVAAGLAAGVAAAAGVWYARRRWLR